MRKTKPTAVCVWMMTPIKHNTLWYTWRLVLHLLHAREGVTHQPIESFTHALSRDGTARNNGPVTRLKLGTGHLQVLIHETSRVKCASWIFSTGRAPSTSHLLQKMRTAAPMSFYCDKNSTHNELLQRGFAWTPFCSPQDDPHHCCPQPKWRHPSTLNTPYE